MIYLLNMVMFQRYVKLSESFLIGFFNREHHIWHFADMISIKVHSIPCQIWFQVKFDHGNSRKKSSWLIKLIISNSQTFSIWWNSMKFQWDLNGSPWMDCSHWSNLCRQDDANGVALRELLGESLFWRFKDASQKSGSF